MKNKKERQYISTWCCNYLIEVLDHIYYVSKGKKKMKVILEYHEALEEIRDYIKENQKNLNEHKGVL